MKILKSLGIVFAIASAAPAQWAANWIWQTADGPQNTWMCFRKTVTLASAPASAPTRIAADTKYWLWINGKLVVFEGGLKHDLPGGAYYDSLDLARYLVAGTNTLAAQVWYFGKDGFSHHSSGKGGFLFEGDFGGTAVRSDATWRAKPHPAYQNSTTGGQPNFRLPESNVRFSAADNSIEGWQQSGYDDSGWPLAVAKGVPPAAPWNALDPRPFPQWKNGGLQAYTNASSLPASSNGGVIEGKLPYDARVSAYLHITTPTAGLVINVQTDQYDGWADFGDGPSVRAEYITRAGAQEFETFVWMSGNSVKYTIPAGVTIDSLRYREIGYPAEFAGAFSSSDPFYNTLWRMAGRTLYINMSDNFSDCPDRERGLWWGDVTNQLGEAFYALDTNANGLIRKSMRALTAWQRSDNTLFAPPSKTWTEELPLQMLASVGWYGFWNYFRYTGDTAAIRANYPAVKKYLGVWRLGSNGLVTHRDGQWNWGDWGDNIDIPVLENAWYYLALKAAIPMAAMSGSAADTTDYHSRMNSIETNFVTTFWNTGAQQFRSSSMANPDDRANAMAVVAGLAKPQHYPGIRAVLQQRTFASPYMEKYVLEALALMGSDSLALARMKSRYTGMVNGPYNTLWELWTGLKDGTINHGWNAPNTILSQYIAGVAPTAAGWSGYHVLPQMANLTAVSQTVATVKGPITVADSLASDRFAMRLSSPPGTKALVGIPKKRAWKSVLANGRPVWNNGLFLTDVPGAAGAGEDSLYIRLSVDPGDWKFEALTTSAALRDPAGSAAPDFGFVRLRRTPAGLEVAWNGNPDFTVQAFDALGKPRSGIVRSSGGRAGLSGGFLPEGIYFIRITSGKSAVMRKFVLAR